MRVREGFDVVTEHVTVAGLTVGAGIVFYPFIYLLNDVLTEVYGYARARRAVKAPLLRPAPWHNRRPWRTCRSRRSTSATSPSTARWTRQRVSPAYRIT